MVKTNWKIWNKNYKVENRTFDRALKKLPEMESAKQLKYLISKIYKKNMKILDVGCAAGHYYHSLKKINNNINYIGIDSTKKYIKFAKKNFKKNKNTSFHCEDIFKIKKKHFKKYDITFCCNVLLHLPNIDLPLKNLIRTSKKFCFVRTLVSDNTHLSKFLYDDQFKQNSPLNYVYQNTYSYNYIKRLIKRLGNHKVEFIEDNFKYKNLNAEYKKYEKKQQGVTQVFNKKLQISGSKVFQWKWIKITLR